MKVDNKNISSLYESVSQLLQNARSSVAGYVNQTMTYTYFEIGRLIVEEEQGGDERAKYGKQLLKSLSKNLTDNFGRGYSVDNLENMRKVYLAFSKRISEKSSPKLIPKQKSEKASRIFSEARFKLSWSHYVFLAHVQNEEERGFYEIEAETQRWSLPEMKRQFNSGFYERLALSKDKQQIVRLSQKGQIVEKPEDVIKDPFVLEFLNLPEHTHYNESDLEKAIINKLEHFMLEMGKGFLFEGRQRRISFEDKHFYIDLSFYNRILKCFVLIDLKIGELTHQDIGQMQMYVNYYDRFIKAKDENGTVGIILCKKKSDTLIEITLPESSDRILARNYQTILPSKAELKKLVNKNTLGSI